MNGPSRRVTSASLLGGVSIFMPEIKYHWWSLTLECGHTVERRVRWKPIPNPRRGWAAQHHGVSLDRLPPKPLRAHCGECVRQPKGAE